MRRLVLPALLTACSLVEGGAGDGPDATIDAMIDATKDATTDATKDAMAEAMTDGSTDSGLKDSGIDTGPADTGIDTGCMGMNCPCAIASDCRNGNEVCLVNACTPCGDPNTDNKPCQNGKTCHEPSSMCK